MTTLNQVAKRAAVSTATVSRVVNNYPHVKPDIRARVLAAIDELGYVPNAAARTMVTKRTGIIGLMLPQVEPDWFGEDATFYSIIVQSISRACTDADIQLLLSVTPQARSVDVAERVLKGGHVDGVIVSVFPSNHPVMGMLARSRLPAVLIGRNPYYPELHWVDVDNFHSAVEAVTYLIQKGRRRIATLAMPSDGSAGTQRRDGYTRALLDYDLPIDRALITEMSPSGDDGVAAIKRLLSLPEPPDAIFAASDGMALRAMEVIHARGLRIPEDIAVIGFDDQPNARKADPPLTTVHQPMRQMGVCATELLLQVIEGQVSEPQHIVLPTSLVVRQSA
jgi:DNA-binding LacI/PurR family transcriptional regulator